MAKITYFRGYIDWIDLDFVQREWIPREMMELGIRFHLAELSIVIFVLEFEKSVLSVRAFIIQDRSTTCY